MDSTVTYHFIGFFFRTVLGREHSGKVSKNEKLLSTKRGAT